MAQDDWFSQGTTGAPASSPSSRGGGWIDDPFKARADARAERSSDRQDNAADRSAANDAERNRLAREQFALDQQKFAQSQGLDAKAKAERTARLTRLESLRGQLDRVDQLYRQNLKGGAPNQLNRLVPDIINPALGQFDSASAGLSEQALGAFRVPGVGSQSDAELRAFVNANQPLQSDSDLRIEEKLGNIRRRLDSEIGSMQPDKDKSGLPISTLTPSEGRPIIDPTGNREFSTDADRALSAEAQAAFNAGATREQINAIAAKYGAAPFGDDLDQAIKGRDAGAKTQFTTPTSGRKDAALGGALGPASASPIGSFGISGLNAMTFGTLDELSGLVGYDPNQTQAAKELASQNNPIASTLGNITGGTFALAAPEAAMARLGIGGGAGIIAPRLAATDATYGAAYGAGENNGDRISGALSGGAMAGLGGVGGRGLMTGGGMAFRGVRDAGVRRLADAGVPMTLGQALSQSGRVGQAVKGVEDRLAGLPLVGDLINSRRMEGLRQFNRAAYDEALAPIGAGSAGQVAEAGIQRAQQAVSQAYDDALNGVSISPDAPFISGMRRVRRDAMSIPNHGATLGHTLDNDLGNLFGNNGILSGENLQAALQTLRQEASTYKGTSLGSSAMGALRNAEGEITDLVGRQAPDVMPALNNANQAYRNTRILEDAVGEAGRNTDGLFTPAQLASMSVRNTKNYGGKAANARGDRPYFELARDGQNILPSKVPDSGTAGRLALPAILGGAGAGAGYLGGDAQTGATLGLALSLPATRAGQRVIQSALIDRPDQFVRIGDQFYRRRAVGGMFGAAASPYLSQGN